MSRGGDASATFFGKVPGRGDFVKGAGQHPLIATLDAWVSGAMELLAEDPGWKAAYDAARPIDFAFVGARSGVSVVSTCGRASMPPAGASPFWPPRRSSGTIP